MKNKRLSGNAKYFQEDSSSLGPKRQPARIVAGHSIEHPSILSLPIVGLFRFGQIEPFLPFSRETWRKLVKAGKAPAPIRMSNRCTVWAAAAIHEFLCDPINYRAPVIANIDEALK